MAKTINRVELLGRVGITPEMKYTPNGTAVTRLRLATDRYRRNGEDAADWHTIVVWGQAGRGREYLRGEGPAAFTWREGWFRIPGRGTTASAATPPRSTPRRWSSSTPPARRLPAETPGQRRAPLPSSPGTQTFPRRRPQRLGRYHTGPPSSWWKAAPLHLQNSA